jgi:hypothetical protein
VIVVAVLGREISYVLIVSRIVREPVPTYESFATDLTTERGKTHGDWTSQAECAQELKKIIREDGEDLPDHKREALEMICVKMSRIMWGNHDEKDHWSDIMGYAQLARDGGHE